MGALEIISTGALLRALVAPTGKELRIADLLAERRGAITLKRELVDLLWGDDPDGGPLDVDGALAVYICRLRARGFQIATFHGRGYAIGVGDALARRPLGRCGGKPLKKQNAPQRVPAPLKVGPLPPVPRLASSVR